MKIGKNPWKTETPSSETKISAGEKQIGNTKWKYTERYHTSEEFLLFSKIIC